MTLNMALMAFFDKSKKRFVIYVKKRFVIYVKKRVYWDNVQVENVKWNVMIYGDGMSATLISGGLNVVNGTTTFATATLGIESEKVAMMSEQKLEKKFDQSPVFVASTLLENSGTLKSTSPASLLKDAIHVVSFGYKDMTDWEKEFSYRRYSDGFKMHCHGWRSIYCVPPRTTFKGSAPINVSDRLHQVLHWALGSVEIFLSRHCALWYGYGGDLKWLDRLSYISSKTSEEWDGILQSSSLKIQEVKNHQMLTI